MLLLFLQFLAAAELLPFEIKSKLVCFEDEVDDPPEELGDPRFSSNFELTEFPPDLALPSPPPT